MQGNSTDVLPCNVTWAAAWTKSRAEKALVDYLDSRKVGSFLPIITRRRVYGKIVRESRLPLFSSYVFFDLNGISRLQLFESRKVADVLIPPNPEELRKELSNLALALQSNIPLCQTSLTQAGTPVQIMRGTLKGVVGETVRMQSSTRLILRVQFIGKAAELEIDEAYVERI